MTLQRNVAARQALVELSRRYAQVTEAKKADGTVRHKCFLSYHSDDAEEVLDFVTKYEDVFIPRSIGVSDQDGNIIDSADTDYVMNVISRTYLADTTVTILLLGRCTWARRYVDWEVYSSLRASSIRTVNGLMAVTLPSVANYEDRKLPGRVADNLKGSNGDRGYARWWKYPTSASQLQGHIQDAFDARTTRSALIDNSRVRRRANSPCS